MLVSGVKPRASEAWGGDFSTALVFCGAVCHVKKSLSQMYFYNMGKESVRLFMEGGGGGLVLLGASYGAGLRGLDLNLDLDTHISSFHYVTWPPCVSCVWMVCALFCYFLLKRCSLPSLSIH